MSQFIFHRLAVLPLVLVQFSMFFCFGFTVNLVLHPDWLQNLSINLPHASSLPSEAGLCIHFVILSVELPPVFTTCKGGMTDFHICMRDMARQVFSNSFCIFIYLFNIWGCGSYGECCCPLRWRTQSITTILVISAAFRPHSESFAHNK